MTPSYIRDVLLFPRDDRGNLKLAGAHGREITAREAHRQYLFLNGVVGVGRAFDALADRLYEEHARAAAAPAAPAV